MTKPAKTPAKAGLRKPPKNAWKPGESGNPNGRPVGSRNRATILAQAVLDGKAEAIIDKVVSAALAGDMTAARMVLERVVPPMRERPVAIAFPTEINSASAVSEAAGAVLKAACEGDLLPSEASTLASILEVRRKAIETQQLEERIAALEEKQK
jgi:hypothetical protein